MELEDQTRELDRAPYPQHMEGTGANVRAIYTTKDGRDYCRETLLSIPVTCSHETAVEYARRYFRNTADSHARAAVAGFRIERW